MDSDEGKLFVGGISWDTSEEELKNYFNQFGEVTQTVIMRDKITGRPRGFGFVVFSDPSVLDHVLQEKHTIDGRLVEAKRALSREEQQHTSSRSGSYSSGRGSGGGGNFKTKKIFVGGLPPTLTEDGFRQYFENYGQVTDVVIMYDQNTQRPRGFGFLSFDTEDAVDRVLQKSFHDLEGKLVEVKRALPKDSNPGGGARGGGYQSFGASAANNNAFDGRIEGNIYTQPQAIAGGFPPYSGYGYGYGVPNSGVGYGGYSSYAVGGYGGAGTGFGGPAALYGNSNAHTGYLGGAPGPLKNAWNNQSSGYGATGPWNGPGGGGIASRGQFPSANQGYMYGSYGGGDGFYGSYGAAGGSALNSNNGSGSGGGGEQHGTSGSYTGSGYGDN